MRWLPFVGGIVLIGLGGVWIFQGIGVLNGSFMTGQSVWGWIGATCVLVGLPVLTHGWRKARR
jgi:hypothetical protein